MLKECNKCGQQIDFKQLPNKKWKPINTDGTDHRCNWNQGNSNGKVSLDSNSLLGDILQQTNDSLVLRIGEYRLDIRKEA